MASESKHETLSRRYLKILPHNENLNNYRPGTHKGRRRVVYRRYLSDWPIFEGGCS